MTTAGIDPARVVVNGASQGGGTALVMAALDSRVAGCLADVPSFAWWDRRIITRTASGGALADYLRRYPQQWDEVYRTLSYYDVMNFTDRIRCPVLASCALADEAVPPECVYAAWNRIASEKTLRVYPTGRHTVEPWQVEEQLVWLRSRLIGT